MSGAARPGPGAGDSLRRASASPGPYRTVVHDRSLESRTLRSASRMRSNRRTWAFSSPYSVTTTRSSPEAWILVAYPASAVISRTYVMSESNRSSPPTRGTGCPAGLM